MWLVVYINPYTQIDRMGTIQATQVDIHLHFGIGLHTHVTLLYMMILCIPEYIKRCL